MVDVVVVMVVVVVVVVIVVVVVVVVIIMEGDIERNPQYEIKRVLVMAIDLRVILMTVAVGIVRKYMKTDLRGRVVMGEMKVFIAKIW